MIILFRFVLVAVALRLSIALVLLFVVWITWCPQRKYAIVVYSNSPVWQEYFETQVIPRLGDRAVVLNCWKAFRAMASMEPETPGKAGACDVSQG
jgi:hypothetical protein